MSPSNFPGVRTSRKKRGASICLLAKSASNASLLSVLLRASDYERATMLRTVRRRVDDLAHEGADELPG